MDTDDFQGRVMPQVEGMTLRDWFAGMILPHVGDFEHLPSRARRAYDIADAMMAERADRDDD